jgi:hypothetical protein
MGDSHAHVRNARRKRRRDVFDALWNVQMGTRGERGPRFVPPASSSPLLADVASAQAGSVDERREVLACAGAASRDDLEQVAQ